MSPPPMWASSWLVRDPVSSRSALKCSSTSSSARATVPSAESSRHYNSQSNVKMTGGERESYRGAPVWFPGGEEGGTPQRQLQRVHPTLASSVGRSSEYEMRGGQRLHHGSHCLSLGLNINYCQIANYCTPVSEARTSQHTNNFTIKTLH